MLEKPKHLGPEYGAQFQDPSVISAYEYRQPYPAETFTLLNGLIADEPRSLLDVGCGRGEIARYMLPFVDRVDAVDLSCGMIEAGKKLPGGADPTLNWICAAVEAAPLQPPYALITAGASLHWMDWFVVMPLFARSLTKNGWLALVDREVTHQQTDAEQGRLIARFSTNRDYRPYNLVAELQQRGLFQQEGERLTSPVPFTQSINAYIEAFHSMNGLSRDRMEPAAAADFDQELANLLDPFATDSQIELQVAARIIWGKPLGE